MPTRSKPRVLRDICNRPLSKQSLASLARIRQWMGWFKDLHWRKRLNPMGLRLIAESPKLFQEWPWDPDILDAVMILRAGGFKTTMSCQGGDGHAGTWPRVNFQAPANGGLLAAGWAMEHGLFPWRLRLDVAVFNPLGDLSRGTWHPDVAEDLQGWEMEFTPEGNLLGAVPPLEKLFRERR